MVHTPSAPSTLLQPHLSCPLSHLLQPCLLSSMPTPTYAHATAHNCATPMYDWIIIGSMSDPCGPVGHSLPSNGTINPASHHTFPYAKRPFHWLERPTHAINV